MSNKTIPSTLPEIGEAAFFCVLDDGETYGGAINSRISIWDAELVDETFGVESVDDFSDAYDYIPKGTENVPIEISLGVVLRYLRKDWGRFTTFCREEGYDLTPEP